MPKTKKKWKKIQLDIPGAAPPVSDKDLFYLDKRGSGKKKRKQPSPPDTSEKKGGTQKLSKTSEPKTTTKTKRIKIKRRLKATDIWKEETKNAVTATPTATPTPGNSNTTTATALDSKPADLPKKKRQKTTATKRPKISPLAVPERFGLIGAQLTVADPGISVNPDPKAQADLLQRAYALDQKEKKEHGDILAHFRGSKNLALDNEGEEKSDDGEEEKDVGVSEPRPLKTKIVSGRRLTQAQRNKKLRKHALHEELKKKKVQKDLKTQLKHLPEVLKKLDEDGVAQEVEKARLEELKKNPDKPLRLGKNLIEKEFPEILLPEEVKGGHFRNLQPSMKVMTDQFKRFQERNLIEPRKKNKYKRRYKLKEYDRFKDPK